VIQYLVMNYANLVLDSVLVDETVELLRVNGGRAPVVHVADIVLKLPNLETDVALLLITDLIKDDIRLQLTDNQELELVFEDFDHRPLNQTDFVVVDLETTGGKTPQGRIIEIGAYRISNGSIVSEFQSLINPQVSIPPFVSTLTGISDTMVRSAPLFSEVVNSWLEFAGSSVLVAHNALFDVGALNFEISRVYEGRRMINPQLCTVSLTRRVIPGLPNYRLHTVAEHLSIPIQNRHRASGDALATALIFIELLASLQYHGVSDLAGLRSFSLKLPVCEE
jgi:DNA polymerase III epsilon subunit family exonuclease